jgi:hypothetical protein
MIAAGTAVAGGSPPEMTLVGGAVTSGCAPTTSSGCLESASAAKGYITAYDKATGDVAVGDLGYVYLVANSTDPAFGLAGGGSLTIGDVYLLAGDGTAGAVTTFGESASASGEEVDVYDSIAFDATGNLILGDVNTTTPTVDFIAASSGTAYGYGTTTAGSIYELADQDGAAATGSGSTAAPAIVAFPGDLALTPSAVALDPEGDIIVDAGTKGFFLIDEQSGDFTAYGQSFTPATATTATMIFGAASGTRGAPSSGGSATGVPFETTTSFGGLAVDSDGNIVFPAMGTSSLSKAETLWLLPAQSGATPYYFDGSDDATATAGDVYLLAGTQGLSGTDSGSGGAGTSAVFDNLSGVALDADGNVLISDESGDTLWVYAVSNTDAYDVPMSGTGAWAAGDVYVLANTSPSSLTGGITDLPEAADDFKLVTDYGVSSDGDGDAYLTSNAANLLELTGGPTPAPPAPTVSAVAPSDGPAVGGTSVTITGTNFVSGATVDFGDAAATDVVVNGSTSITADAPAGTPGAVDVTVTESGETSVTSPSDQFTYSLAPTVTAVSPDAGPTAAGTVVTITGTGFVSGSTTVSFGGTDATDVSVTNSTTLTADAAAGSAGTVVDVQVSTTDGGESATSSADEFAYGAPTVASLSTSNGPIAGGGSVTITGTGFVPGSTVQFGTTAGTSVVVNSSTSITADAPGEGGGTVDVRVTNADGQSAVNAPADQFTYSLAPTVTAVSPDAGPTGAGTAVTITGTGFVSGSTTVTFGGTDATDVSVTNSTTLTADAAAGSAGTVVDVQASTTDGTSATGLSDEFAYGAPTVASLGTSGGLTTGGTSVTVTGTGFVPGATVQFGSTAGADVVVNSSTSITAASPAESAGTVDVHVTNADGQSAVNAPADQFTYITPSPTVSVVNPNSGSTAGGTSVTITGTNFAAGATVKFGTTAGTGVVVNSSTSITAVSPSESAGIVDVTVTVSGQTSATSDADQFTYNGGAGGGSTPTVTAVSPDSGPASGGTTVTISGTNFVSGATVDFGTAQATGVTVSSATSITGTAPPGSGTVDVTVTDTGGTSATSSADNFIYTAAPTVTAVSPDSGPAAGGTTVTISGSNFASGATVDFGTAQATGVTVSNATSIAATAPAGSGTVDVTVTDTGGTSATSSADNFIYTATQPPTSAPTVTAVSPDSGPTAGGTTVTITGSGFVTGMTVQFGSAPATGVTVAGSASLTAVSPPGSGTVDVTVTTSGGTSATSAADQFNYMPTSAPPPPLAVGTTYGTPTSTTVSAGSPGTATASWDGLTGTVSFPSGALPAGSVVSVFPVIESAGLAIELSRTESYVTSFAVSWLAPNGTSPAATAPITLVITDKSVKKGEVILEVTTSGFKKVGTASKNGSATVTFLSDPTFVIARVPVISVTSKRGSLSRTGVELTLSCTAGLPCAGTATLSVPEKVKHGKKTETVRLAVATVHYSLKAGAKKNVVLVTTKTGKPILSSTSAKVRSGLEVTASVSGGTALVQKLTVA